jgi:hypothetical protein
MDLFLPEPAAREYGAWIWVLLLVLYGLIVTIVLMLMRPRLVIYNIGTEQLRPILADIVSDLDADARWAGDSLLLPKLGVQLHVEPFQTLKNTQLVSSGPHQSHAGWRRLERSLSPVLRKTTTRPNQHGLGLLLLGLLMVALITFFVVKYDQTLLDTWREMLRQ